MSPTRVTIVIAAHNAARWLAQTLDSVLAQTMADWHCHVVDDGSTDGTAAVVERYQQRDPRFTLTRQLNAGVSAARNRALADTVGDGPFVSILDSDDVWLPDALQVLCSALDEDPTAVGVQSLAEYIDEAGHPTRPGEHPAIQRRKFQVMGDRVVPASFGPGLDFGMSPRPVRPRSRVIGPMSRVQSRLWAADHAPSVTGAVADRP